MEKFKIVIGLLFSLNLLFVNAAPEPWGIALNHKTKECAGFWAGDEFTYYGLQEGWQDYYEDYESGYRIIKTDIGECNFSLEDEEVCCNELNYTFISDNIGILYSNCGDGECSAVENEFVCLEDCEKSYWWLFIIGAIVTFIMIFYILRKKH